MFLFAITGPQFTILNVHLRLMFKFFNSKAEEEKMIHPLHDELPFFFFFKLQMLILIKNTKSENNKPSI